MNFSHPDSIPNILATSLNIQNSCFLPQLLQNQMIKTLKHTMIVSHISKGLEP